MQKLDKLLLSILVGFIGSFIVVNVLGSELWTIPFVMTLIYGLGLGCYYGNKEERKSEI